MVRKSKPCVCTRQSTALLKLAMPIKTWKIKKHRRLKKDVIKTSFFSWVNLTGLKLKVVTDWLSLANFEGLGEAVQAKKSLSSMKKFVML
ncbi:MAG: hypothetical protein U1E92_01075 [Moraxella osloensis]